MTVRRIFNYDNINETKLVSNMADKNQSYENSISSGGCLFYKIVDNKVKLLLIKYTDPNWPRFDDLGGKIDETDVSVQDAIMREVSEETNGIIIPDFLQYLFKEQNTLTFYNKFSKYYLKLIRVSDTFYPDTTVFGTFEGADRIERTIHWYDFEDVKDNLAYRLSNINELMDYLSIIPCISFVPY